MTLPAPGKLGPSPPHDPHRVLHLIHGEHWSGGEQSLYLLLKYLDRRRYDPTVICLSGGLLRDRLEHMGIKTELVPMSGKWDLSVVLPIRRIIDRLAPHLVITQTPRTNLLGRLATRGRKVPIFTIVQAPISRDTNAATPAPMNARIERWTSRWTQRYVGVSQAVAEDLVDLGVSRDRIGVIYNSFDPAILEQAPYPPVLRQELGLDAGHPLIGMLASFRPRKGAETLIDAMPLITEAVPSAILALVGHGNWVDGEDYLACLRRRAKDRGVEDRVLTLGFREDVPQVLSSLSVKVLPSLFGEGSSLVLMEAMALGVPVVASDTEGNNEVVQDEKSGLLFCVRDSSALARAVIRILTQGHLAERLATAGRDRAREHFAADHMAHAYVHEYDNLLGPADVPEPSASSARERRPQ